ncbi:hypothetical protein CIRG_03755 [Coccidioides immitis RMSCC 2394]|nr:hypothetical protein CIRG_03755 [Coccidioides immitis RMSCC 2394]
MFGQDSQVHRLGYKVRLYGFYIVAWGCLHWPDRGSADSACTRGIVTLSALSLEESVTVVEKSTLHTGRLKGAMFRIPTAERLAAGTAPMVMDPRGLGIRPLEWTSSGIL